MSMNLHDVTALIIAPARTGKTYYMTRWIVTYLIPQTKKKIVTNLPLKLQEIADYCFKKFRVPVETTISRITLIPREVEMNWKNNGKRSYAELTPEQQAGFTNDGANEYGNTEQFVYDGPWLYFKDSDLDGSVLILDEVHNFCGMNVNKIVSERWLKFLGELGHRKCVFRGITQSYSALGPGIKAQLTSRYLIKNSSLDRLPFVGVTLYEVQMLLKAFFGIPFYQPILIVRVKRDEINSRRTVRDESCDRCLMTPEIFNLYDSFNKPIEGSQEIDENENKAKFQDRCDEYRERFGKVFGALFLLGDVFVSHFVRLGICVGILSVLLLLCFDHTFFLNYMRQFSAAFKGIKEKNKDDTKPDITNPAVNKSSNQLAISGSYINNVIPLVFAVMPDCVYFANGVVARVGDILYDDIKLVHIDYKKRVLALSNGKRVGLIYKSDIAVVSDTVTNPKSSNPTPPPQNNNGKQK